MEVDDIISKIPRKHDVCYPGDVCITSFNPEERGHKPMKKIPGKITAFFRRDKIAKVYKLGVRYVVDDYVIKTTDGTMFWVNFF